MKGYFALTTSWIISFILIMGTIVIAWLALSQVNKDNVDLLLVDYNEYNVRQELNQLMNTKVEYNNRQYSFAHLITIYQFDDNVEDTIKATIKDFYGGGEIYKQHTYFKDDVNIIVIAVLGNDLTSALTDANERYKNFDDETKDIGLFDIKQLDAPEFAWIRSFFGEVIHRNQVKNRLLYDTEDLISDLEKDRRYSVHAINLAGLTSKPLVVVLLKDAE